MGAWGYEPFENDGDLDWRGDFDDRLGLREAIIKEVRQKESASVSRAAIEYAIRLDDAGLLMVYGDDEFIDIMLKRGEELKKEFADPSGYGRYPGDDDDDSLKQAIRGHVRSMDRQIKYLEGLQAKKVGSDSKLISKSELSDAYERLRKKRGKGKSKGPVAARKERISSRKELMESYARLRESKRRS